MITPPPTSWLEPALSARVLLNKFIVKLRKYGLIRNLRWLACLSLLTTVVLAACTNRTEPQLSVENLAFKTLEGVEISLQNSRGPVLVNFWSTSCTVCLREMPEMAELYEQYHQHGFELIAVAMPYDAPNLVLELTEQRQLPFPVALDLKGEAAAAFGSVVGTPTSFLLDADSTLIKRYVGAIEFEALRQELNKLLDIS